MDKSKYIIYNTMDDKVISCERCGMDCIFVVFPETPEYVLEAARERGLYVCTTEEGLHVMAVCEHCVDRITRK